MEQKSWRAGYPLGDKSIKKGSSWPLCNLFVETIASCSCKISRGMLKVTRSLWILSGVLIFPLSHFDVASKTKRKKNVILSTFLYSVLVAENGNKERKRQSCFGITGKLCFPTLMAFGATLSSIFFHKWLTNDGKPRECPSLKKERNSFSFVLNTRSDERNRKFILN